MRVAVLIIVAFLALLPAGLHAHEGTEVSVRGEVRANGSIELQGEDFAPNDVVRIELRKEGVEPVEIGRVPADAEGAFTETLHVPATVRPGIYQLAADGEEFATVDVTVLEPAAGDAPVDFEPPSTESVSNDRPAGEVVGLTIFAATVAAVAAGLLWWSRTRPRRLVR